VQDVAREAAIEKGGGIEAVSAAAAAPQKDLSLKDGEKIKMNVAGAAAGKRRAKKEGELTLLLQPVNLAIGAQRLLAHTLLSHCSSTYFKSHTSL
jgi:hypothetical protein